jgi:threonine/homoserine/homoserine lactone efflux protein
MLSPLKERSMFEAGQILGFLAAVIVLIVVPGPNTVIILAQSVGGGRAAGLATVAGVEVGTLVHTLAAALGLSALLATSSYAFHTVKLAGAVYLIVIGYRMLRHETIQLASAPQLSAPVAFGRALVTNLLNPKSALFFLAFLPQFVRAEQGNVFLQFVLLGLIVSALGLCFGSTLVMAAGSLRRRFRQNARFDQWLSRIAGCALIGVGIRLAFVHAD